MPDNKVSNNGKYNFMKAMQDCLLVYLLCATFYILHSLYFQPAASLRSIISMGGIIFGLWSAITCLPAFLIGLRIMNSTKAFFVLSWLTVVAFFALSLWLSQNLTYSIGYLEVYNSDPKYDSFPIAIPTAFGFFYKLFTPRIFMAFYASWLFWRDIMNRQKL